MQPPAYLQYRTVYEEYLEAADAVGGISPEVEERYVNRLDKLWFRLSKSQQKDIREEFGIADGDFD